MLETNHKHLTPHTHLKRIRHVNDVQLYCFCLTCKRTNSSLEGSSFANEPLSPLSPVPPLFIPVVDCSGPVLRPNNF